MQIQGKESPNREEVRNHLDGMEVTFIPLDNFRCKPGKGQLQTHEYLNMA